MRKYIVLFVLIGIGSLFSADRVSAQDEKESAKVPVNDYLQAQATGNAEFIRKAFHADAKIISFSDGKLSVFSVDEFASRFNGKTAPDEAQRKREIVSFDVSGNAASAKLVLDYPTIKFVDYLNLLKIDGEWKIVNKTFYREMKAQPKK